MINGSNGGGTVRWHHYAAKKGDMSMFRNAK